MRLVGVDELTQARIRRAVRLRRFTLASQARLRSIDERLVARFMKRISGLDEYLVTDESKLSDFATTAIALARIKRSYGLRVRRGAYVVDVLERISQARPSQR
jgi:hypothetical protein